MLEGSGVYWNVQKSQMTDSTMQNQESEIRKDLTQIRKQLDNIDEQIVDLYQKRIALCSDVAEYKILMGKSVLDKEREKEKLITLMAMTDSVQNQKAVYELYKQIMTASRRYQYQCMGDRGKLPKSGFQMVNHFIEQKRPRIVYQGSEGAYQEIAAKQYFQKMDYQEISASFYHVPEFRDIILEIQEERADFAVIPIENSSAGQVSDTYDILAKYPVYIVAEIFLPVQHTLLGIKEAELGDIKTVYSHIQGLMQCENYLSHYPHWQKVSLYNTALSAKKVSREKDKTQAAIASPRSKEVYDLKILAENINDNDGNTTRFVIITGKQIYQKDANKISITFTLPHKTGSLYDTLGHIIFNGLNMIKIESRPIPEKEWEYRFFVDIEGNLGYGSVINALAGIKAEAEEFKILGNY